MDDLFSLMYNIGKRVDSLSDSVKQIYQMEEETAEHMLKTEDRVSELVQNEEDMPKKVESIAQNEGDIAKKVGNIDTQMTILRHFFLKLKSIT